jgi:hypothetical protein
LVETESLHFIAEYAINMIVISIGVVWTATVVEAQDRYRLAKDRWSNIGYLVLPRASELLTGGEWRQIEATMEKRQYLYTVACSSDV